jgi:hypothetical protein
VSPVATAHWVTLAALGVAGAATAAAPTVSVSELAHCAAIVAVDQRLACYDTLAVAKMPPPAAPATTIKAGAPAAAAPTAVTAAASPAPAAAGGFGMSTHVAPVELSTQAITAHVVAASADRQGNTFVSLDNGQTWTYVDIYGPPVTGSVVTIKRAALGSYLITTSDHHTFRAQRTK